MPSTSKRLRKNVTELESQLAAASNERSRAFWEKYLKGAIPFRGVPMGEIRKIVRRYWSEHETSLSIQQQKELAIAMFEGRFAEDKLAGTLALQEVLLPHLEHADVGALANLFDRGLIADWNTCDWFCVKVLGRLVERDLPEPTLARAIAAWCHGASLWQRRASNVAFVNLAPRGEGVFPGFTRLMLDTCAVTVRCPERFAQTGVGWLLRELARAEPAPVIRFTRAHLAFMSREAVKYVVERAPEATRRALLDEHARKQPRSKPAGLRKRAS